MNLNTCEHNIMGTGVIAIIRAQIKLFNKQSEALKKIWRQEKR